MSRRRFPRSDFSKQNVVVAALLFASLIITTLIFVGLTMTGPADDPQAYRIEKVIDVTSRIGRGELQQIKNMPPNISKEDVFKAVGMPMVKLIDLETKQAGVVQQYAYPLAYAPQIQIVLLFKSERLLGFKYAFNGTIPPKETESPRG